MGGAGDEGAGSGVEVVKEMGVGNKKGLEQEVQDLVVGVAGFELATSASLRRRSNQAEPHPVTRNLLYNTFRVKSSIFEKLFYFSKNRLYSVFFLQYLKQKLPHSPCGFNVEMLLSSMNVKHVGTDGYAVKVINL